MKNGPNGAQKWKYFGPKRHIVATITALWSQPHRNVVKTMLQEKAYGHDHIESLVVQLLQGSFVATITTNVC